MTPSVQNVSRAYRHTKYRFLQFSYICFPTSPLVVDCEFSHYVKLPGCGSPLLPYTQFLFVLYGMLCEGLVSVVEVLFVP